MNLLQKTPRFFKNTTKTQKSISALTFGFNNSSPKPSRFCVILSCKQKIKYRQCALKNEGGSTEDTKLKESLLEILYLTKSCLTTFWFWLPVLFAGCFFLQIWMMFCVHPLTVLILPAVLCAFGILQEQKSIEAQHGLVKTKVLKASHGLGMGPESLPLYQSEIEKIVEEYTHFLKKKRARQKQEK